MKKYLNFYITDRSTKQNALLKLNALKPQLPMKKIKTTILYILLYPRNKKLCLNNGKSYMP